MGLQILFAKQEHKNGCRRRLCAGLDVFPSERPACGPESGPATSILAKKISGSAPIARSLPSSWLAWALVTLSSSPSSTGSAGDPRMARSDQPHRQDRCFVPFAWRSAVGHWKFAGRLLSTMLAAIAEFERELIRERTGEGRKRAMANGLKFGRKRKLSVLPAG